MLSAVRSLISGESRRFFKYSFGGMAVGAGTLGGAAYLMIESLNMKIQEDAKDKLVLPEPISFLEPVAHYVVQKVVEKGKKEAIEECATHGAWSGLSIGMSLGFTRVTLGVVYRGLKFIISRGKSS